MPPPTTTSPDPVPAPASTKMLLTATYASPTNAPFTITTALAPPASGTAAPTVPDKTAYLAALRTAAAGLQEQINKKLTQRMDEDNKTAASNKKALDDAKAEENYGEEGQEDEDE